MPKRDFDVSYYLILYVLLLIINFYVQFLKLNFRGNNLNLSLKITYKNKITHIKKIPRKIATAVNLRWFSNFYRFFANF